MKTDHNLTRRTLLSSGLAATALLPLKAALARADACTLIPEQELGPYYIPDELVRSDIREGKLGIPLDLRVHVLDINTCRPLVGAAVDLWHCDADGVYSGFDHVSTLPPPEPPPAGALPASAPPVQQPTDRLTFLRGIQLTDHHGLTRFRTILPGCYPGRTNHIHFKVRLAGALAGRTYRGGHVSHAGQIFFPEEIVAPLMRADPYALHQVERTPQAEDSVYTRQNGRASTVSMQPVLGGSRGFGAWLMAAVDPNGHADPA